VPFQTELREPWQERVPELDLKDGIAGQIEQAWGLAGKLDE
jgi:hypothetical protein